MKSIEQKSPSILDTIHKPQLVLGIDELNLAEFPLASISERRLDGRKTVVFEEPLFDRNEGKTVIRRLTISGSDRFGLPTARDEDILLACIQISKLRDFQSRTVTFSRYEILRMLRLPDSTSNYARLATGLRRWKGVSIFSDRAFYDHAQKSWVNRDFGIFDNLYLYSREAEGSEKKATSRFTWNEVLFNSFQSGYLKRLDWELYTSLISPVAKRLYRFLDKRFYHGSSFEMNLRELAVKRVGLPSTYNTAQIKRGLITGIEELENRWDLRVIGNEKRFIKQSRGEWLIRFERKRVVKPTPCNSLAIGTTSLKTSTGSPQIATQLVKRGIGPASAEELSQSHPHQSITTMIELFDWYNQRGQNRGAGFLVQSIKNPSGIELPKGFESSHQANARRESEKATRSHHHCLATAREKQAADRAKNRQQAFIEYWQSLSPTAQSEFEDLAVQQSELTKRQGYYRHQGREGPLFEEYRQVILIDHFERTSLKAKCPP